MHIRYLLIPLAVMLMGALTGLHSEDLSPSKEVSDKPSYVDLDGDGFNDNLDDNDADGIPDDLSKPREAQGQAPKVAEGLMAGVKALSVSQPVFLRNSGSYGYLKRALLPLTQHRGGFSTGSEFGPGRDIGSGAVLGGPCSGGACCQP